MSKTVLICGASGGLGQVMGEMFVQKGLNVFGTMRAPEKATANFAFPMLAMDATDEASVARCLNEVKEKAGRIDVIVNCVNNMVLGSVEETSMEEFQHLYNVNLFGIVRVCRTAVPLMRTQGGGTIINMSSLGGLLAVPYLSAYTSAKFAIEAFTEALYHELKNEPIDVVIMQPVAMRMDRPETGDHLHAVRGAAPDSPTHKMIAQMARDTAASKLTPEMVSKEIYRVIHTKKKKLRYPMDRAKALGLVKRFAPQSMIDRLIGGLVASAMKQPA